MQNLLRKEGATTNIIESR